MTHSHIVSSENIFFNAAFDCLLCRSFHRPLKGVNGHSCAVELPSVVCVMWLSHPRLLHRDGHGCVVGVLPGPARVTSHPGWCDVRAPTRAVGAVLSCRVVVWPNATWELEPLFVVTNTPRSIHCAVSCGRRIRRLPLPPNLSVRRIRPLVVINSSSSVWMLTVFLPSDQLCLLKGSLLGLHHFLFGRLTDKCLSSVT